MPSNLEEMKDLTLQNRAKCQTEKKQTKIYVHLTVIKDGFHLGLAEKGLFNPKVQVKVGHRGRYHYNAALCTVATWTKIWISF